MSDLTHILGPLSRWVWQGSSQTPGAGLRTLPTGHRGLDAQLLGGGWPCQAVTELLIPHAGLGEIRLLAPALRSIEAQRQRVVLIDPPAHLCLPALTALGLQPANWWVVRARSAGRGALHGAWAAEQALRSACLGAVLWWAPPRLSPMVMQRLQTAAMQHEGLAFVWRDMAMALQPSAAALRLRLRAAAPDVVAVHVLKQRGVSPVHAIHVPLPATLFMGGLRRHGESDAAAGQVPASLAALSASGRPKPP